MLLKLLTIDRESRREFILRSPRYGFADLHCLLPPPFPLFPPARKGSPDRHLRYVRMECARLSLYSSPFLSVKQPGHESNHSSSSPHSTPPPLFPTPSPSLPLLVWFVVKIFVCLDFSGLFLSTVRNWIIYVHVATKIVTRYVTLLSLTMAIKYCQTSVPLYYFPVETT